MLNALPMAAHGIAERVLVACAREKDKLYFPIEEPHGKKHERRRSAIWSKADVP